MSQFLLLLHETPAELPDWSPEEMQKVIEEYQAWGQRLAEAGRFLSSEKLKDGTGRSLRKGDNGLVIDGPFSETKEVVGGFYLIEARDYDQAAELCRDCPHLAYGGRIEVREIEKL